MKPFGLIVSVAVFGFGFALLGAFSTLDSGMPLYWGLILGGFFGSFLGLAFGGARGKVLGTIYGPEDEMEDRGQ
jgi:hypothetical protein